MPDFAILPTQNPPQGALQVSAYRFVYCMLNGAVVGEEQVVRHRCHNRLCFNPEHLTVGSRADNKRDDWENWANGVDHSLL